MAICCIIYGAYLNSHLNSFCDELRKKFTYNDLSCSLLIDRFSMKDDSIFVASTNYYMAKSVAYIRIFLWLFAGFVMLLRFILGADFELEEVEYCAEQSGSAFDPQGESSKVKFIDDGIRRYSREKVYKPTTQSQIDE